MNFSPTLAIMIVLGILGIGAVVAAGDEYTPPKPQEVANSNACYALAVKHLLAAVDSNQAQNQDWNLKAADAYQQLQALGFEDCA
jgi:hypothetical protein